MQDISLRPYSR